MYQYNDRLTQLFTKYKYIWYLVAMFRPFTGSSSGLYKDQKVYYIFKFCVPNGIPCGLQICAQLVQGATKRWKTKCNNTQHISCPVCPLFLVEFGVFHEKQRADRARDTLCVITFNFPYFRRSLYKLCTTL
jgi:hypothetical protein